MERLSGYLEKIVSEDTQEIVAQIKVPYRGSFIMIKGPPPSSPLRLGALLHLRGKWSDFSHEEKFFRVSDYGSDQLRNNGVINYLSSKLIKGIGPKIAAKIVETFQDDTCHILDYAPEKLVKIPGISEGRCQELCKQLREQKSLRATVLFLQQYGVAVHYGIRLHEKYQDQAITKICSDPFLLSKEMDGIGFKTADFIARCIGMPLNSTNRVMAGVFYMLSLLQEEGHTCYALQELSALTETLLNENLSEKVVNQQQVAEHIRTMAQQHLIHLRQIDNKTYVWLQFFYQAEQGIVTNLKRIFSCVPHIRPIDPDRAILWVEEHLDLQLAEQQKEAIRASFCHKVHIITGGPGTGKSTITRAILKIFEQKTRKIILAAPTGKAAKRMAEITGKHAVTIHSLLQYSFQTRSFRKGDKNPIDCDLMIIDESGMLDTLLFHHFLKALPNHVILILIGDIYQLPSVGAGNILKDLISSNKITVTHLTEIFRQAHNSSIVINAHRINNGELPVLHSDSYRKDFLFFHRDDPQEAADYITHLVTSFLPQKFHIYARDIQVLSPMKKGVLGIHYLNKALKNALNPNKPTLWGKFYGYSTGDKVMQTRNNYNKEVFNGEIGYVTKVNFTERSLVVDMDGRYVPYSTTELDDLVLAYATSVHKYQGSESPCIIIPIHTSHFMMLYRNLLYTAITRGKQLVVLVGTKKAIAIATKNDRVQQRCTGLVQALTHVNLQR